MFKKLIYLLSIAATIVIGTILYYIFCCNCSTVKQIVDNNEKTVTISKKSSNPFVLKGLGINYQCNDNFNFLKNNSTLITPINDSIEIGLESLKEMLIENPKQNIIVTGYALSSEENPTSFENLALARAESIKAFLNSKGFPKAQVDIKGELLDSWETAGDTLLGPLKFQFNELEFVKNNDDLNSLKDKINADPLVLHFNTNKSSENLSKEEHQKVIDLTKYIAHVPDAKVQIVGYSDNSGSREANIKLAQKRAEFTKNYLVRNGIKSSSIETNSVGPDQPISDNNTADGRAQNRRTVITIK